MTWLKFHVDIVSVSCVSVAISQHCNHHNIVQFLQSQLFHASFCYTVILYCCRWYLTGLLFFNVDSVLLVQYLRKCWSLQNSVMNLSMHSYLSHKTKDGVKRRNW